MSVLTSAETPAPLARDTAINRRLGWIIALAGLALAVFSGARTWLTFHDFAPWWTAGAVLLCVLLLDLVVGGLWMPLPLLRVFWCAVAPLSVVLTSTSFLAYQGEDLDLMRPWPWAIEPAALAFLVLVVPSWVAISAAVVSAAAPAVASFLLTGAVTPGIAGAVSFHVGSIALVVILVGLRSRLSQLHDSEQLAKAAATRQARLEAENERQHALTRMVHDEVLAVFTAALQLGGTVPYPLQRAADQALGTLAHDGESPAGTMTADAAAESLRETASTAAPGCIVEATASGGEVPRHAVAEIGFAAAEALRNSIRHSGSPTPPRVTLVVGADEIAVTVADDGAGFDPDAIEPRRLGVRESIVGRMEGLDGGSASLISAPGAGTEVRLRWHR